MTCGSFEAPAEKVQAATPGTRGSHPARIGNGDIPLCRKRSRLARIGRPIREWDSSDITPSVADDTQARRTPTVRRAGSDYDRADSMGMERGMETKSLRAALGVALACGGLAACDRNDAATVGQKLDRAVEKTEKSVADAGAKTREALRENTPKIEEKLDAAGRKIGAATNEAVDKTRETVRETRDSVTSPSSSSAAKDTTAGSRSDTGGRSDALITASVKADFIKDPDLSVLKIDVDTHDGVVTLNGLAGNEDAKQRAEKMASAVKGVREVRNYLTIKRG
jgi:hyperosmotically inducible periplasmic protein